MTSIQNPESKKAASGSKTDEQTHLKDLNENDSKREPDADFDTNPADFVTKCCADSPFRKSKKALNGMVELPKINSTLPLFENTSTPSLNTGAGIVSGTDRPDQGPGTHSTIAAHRGFYGTPMFRHLDKVNVNDNFYITYNGKRMKYRVIETQIIKPTEKHKLAPKVDQELATLLTCHPLHSSKYRLLVTGQRV